MSKADKKKTYYGWADIANFDEAVEFFAEKWAFGYNITEINKMLDAYFPKIDYITCGKIRVKALKKLYTLAKQIEKGNYIAESIMRLRRLMANPREKTKNILSADAQLTHLLGLADASETESLEERAALLRAFVKSAREATDGTSQKEQEKSENRAEQKEPEKSNTTEEAKEVKTSNDVSTNSSNQSDSKSNVSYSVESVEDKKEMENVLKLARAKRLTEEINQTEKSLRDNRQRLDDECENGN